MADARRFEKLKSALGPTPDCPSLDRLAWALERDEDDPRRKLAEEHVATCAHCRDELALTREFADAGPRADETAAVAWIARRVEKQRVFRPSRPRFSFIPGMRAFAAAACLILVAAGALYLRRGPGEPSPAAVGEGAMRSEAIELIAPIGDVRQKPAAFQWRAVPGAVRYQVRVLEVDRREVWRGESSGPSIAIPAPVLALLGPGKTLLWDVSAWDLSGKPIGASGVRSFQVAPDAR